jgi:hypothetical protein
VIPPFERNGRRGLQNKTSAVSTVDNANGARATRRSRHEFRRKLRNSSLEAPGGFEPATEAERGRRAFNRKGAVAIFVRFPNGSQIGFPTRLDEFWVVS